MAMSVVCFFKKPKSFGKDYPFQDPPTSLKFRKISESCVRSVDVNCRIFLWCCVLCCCLLFICGCLLPEGL